MPRQAAAEGWPNTCLATNKHFQTLCPPSRCMPHLGLGSNATAVEVSAAAAPPAAAAAALPPPPAAAAPPASSVVPSMSPPTLVV